MQKFFGYANRLLQQLVSDDLGDEDAGCGGPGLLWLHVVCGCEASETPLETAYCREMNIQFTGNSSGGHSLQSVCQLHAPSKLVTFVALCCVIKLLILEWSFIVASLRHTCAIIMLSKQHFDMPHL